MNIEYQLQDLVMAVSEMRAKQIQAKKQNSFKSRHALMMAERKVDLLLAEYTCNQACQTKIYSPADNYFSKPSSMNFKDRDDTFSMLIVILLSVVLTLALTGWVLFLLKIYYIGK